MLKRVCIAVFFALGLVSSGFAQGKVDAHGKGRMEVGNPEKISAQSFTSSDIFFDRVHMCSSTKTSGECEVPEMYTTAQPSFHIYFWAPSTQTYGFHQIITDTSGTVLLYEYYENFLFSGWATVRYFPGAFFSTGDYIYSLAVVGFDGTMGVPRQYLFSVR